MHVGVEVGEKVGEGLVGTVEGKAVGFTVGLVVMQTLQVEGQTFFMPDAPHWSLTRFLQFESRSGAVSQSVGDTVG